MTKHCVGCDSVYPVNELRCGEFCEKCVAQIINEFTTLVTDHFTPNELVVINDCFDGTSCNVEEINEHYMCGI